MERAECAGNLLRPHHARLGALGGWFMSGAFQPEECQKKRRHRDAEQQEAGDQEKGYSDSGSLSNNRCVSGLEK